MSDRLINVCALKASLKSLVNQVPYLRVGIVGIVGVVCILLITYGISALLVRFPVSAEPIAIDAQVSARCMECGVVESTRLIEQSEEKFDQSTAGRVSKDGRNELPKKATNQSEVTVRMNDGASHLFEAAIPTNWKPGERVIFIEGNRTPNH